ncbi:hypothetical protein DEV91_12529 [Phyllobacterium brassicacearum]|nr:hypothetical protein DEV91_12529 [Phyllobacterium brassicacearum]
MLRYTAKGARGRSNWLDMKCKFRNRKGEVEP